MLVPRAFAVILGAAFAVGAGCSPATEPAPAAPVAVTVPAAAATGAAVTAVAPEPSANKYVSPDQFVWSPVTPLADELAALARAALRGEELPSRIPTEPIDPDYLVLSRGEQRPDPNTLEFLAFGLAFEVAFGADAAAPGARTPGLEGVVLLSRQGVHVVMLRRDVVRLSGPLPSWLDGAPKLVDGILTAARDGTLGSLVVTDELRTTFGDEWDQVQNDLPSPAEVRDLESYVQSNDSPTGYDVDDLVLLGRDHGGGRYSLSLNVDEHQGRVVLDARPLIRVKRVSKPAAEKRPAADRQDSG